MGKAAKPMVKAPEKLDKPFTVLAIKRWANPGLYADAEKGLYLQVTDGKKGTTKSWIFRYRHRGTSRLVMLGLGSLEDVSLAEARDKAKEMRNQLANGVDPKHARAAQRAAAMAESERMLTFDQAAAKCIAAKRLEWKNEKHAEQWTNTLATYASLVFGKLPVCDIDLPLVRKVLDPIWSTKTETASRVRQRIETVLAWATASGLRTGDNPARWKGNLDVLLGKPSKIQQRKHHPALPYAEINDFMEALRAQQGIAGRALEFLVLTAARTEGVIGAHWDEIDLRAGLWTIPAERMKAKKAHTIPLSGRALVIAKELSKTKISDFVSPNPNGKPLSNAAMAAVVKRMNANRVGAGAARWVDSVSGDPIVPHGFRSTFRDWAGEQTNYAREVIEAGMAHQLKDKAEAAHARGNMPERRRKLMEAWARYCETSGSQRSGGSAPGRSVGIVHGERRGRDPSLGHLTLQGGPRRPRPHQGAPGHAPGPSPQPRRMAPGSYCRSQGSALLYWTCRIRSRVLRSSWPCMEIKDGIGYWMNLFHGVDSPRFKPEPGSFDQLVEMDSGSGKAFQKKGKRRWSRSTTT